MQKLESLGTKSRTISFYTGQGPHGGRPAGQAAGKAACTHDAQVKMAGFKDLYECTGCHRFIRIKPSETP